MESAWKWISRTADVVQIGSVGVAIIVGAIVGAELELRHASQVWVWIATTGVGLIALAAIRRLLAWWKTRFDSVGGDRYYFNKRIRLVDLVGQDSIIRDRTLEDCEVHGPMVLMSTGRGVGGFASCTWNGRPEATFMTTAEPRVGGVVGLENCVFRRCRFFNVAIMTSPTADIPQWREGFGITEA